MKLAIEKRDIVGKKVHALRAQGMIPGELYGHGIENVHIMVPEKDFTSLYKEAGESTMIIAVLDGEDHPVMIHDMVRDPLDGSVESIDLYQVRMDEVITAHVPLEFTGEAPAVKSGEGVLVKSMHEIECEALPQNMPHSLSVDLGSLDAIGKSVHVSDITFPEGVASLIDKETAVASITEQREEEEETQTMDVADIKVVGEEKKAKEVEADSGETENTK